MYLQPKTRVITTKGTPIACDPLTTAIYRINNKWYILTPEANKLTTAPEIIQPGLLPWGRDSATRTSSYAAEEQKFDAQTSRLPSETTSIYTKIIAAIIIIIIIMLIITVLYVLKSGERKRHLSYPPQFSETAAVKTQTRCPRHAPDDADPPRGSLHEHRNSHLEALHRAYDSHENRLDLASEISNLKDAYRILDIRINNCISPTRAGLNKLAVASSQRCSQSNEGGVTYGASA